MDNETQGDGIVLTPNENRQRTRALSLLTDVSGLQDDRQGPKVPTQRSSGVVRLALETLHCMGVPLDARLVAQIVSIRHRVDRPVSIYAALSEVERRTQLRGGGNTVWVAPAIHATRLTPIPALLTRSDWGEVQRVVDVYTLRVLHLHILLKLLELWETARGRHDDTTTGRLAALAARYGRSVAGVSVSATFEPRVYRTAARDELSLIARLDRAHREDAAARLARHAPSIRAWGLPIVAIEGEDT